MFGLASAWLSLGFWLAFASGFGAGFWLDSEARLGFRLDFGLAWFGLISLGFSLDLGWIWGWLSASAWILVACAFLLVVAFALLPHVNLIKHLHKV